MEKQQFNPQKATEERETVGREQQERLAKLEHNLPQLLSTRIVRLARKVGLVK
jgi:hypothetical protein